MYTRFLMNDDLNGRKIGKCNITIRTLLPYVMAVVVQRASSEYTVAGTDQNASHVYN